MKEEYGSGFDGTPEQALKYAQDTPGQELEVKRLLKLIRNKKMSKTLKIVKEVIKDKLLREQDTSGWETKVKKNRKTPTPEQNQNQSIPEQPPKEYENVGGWMVPSQKAKKLRNLLPPPLPERNPKRKLMPGYSNQQRKSMDELIKQKTKETPKDRDKRQQREIQKQRKTPPLPGPLIPDRTEKRWI
jgi:hypothetical protein